MGLLTLQRTYTLAPNPPPRVAWATYRARLDLEWQQLLDSGNLHDESLFQDFLERHPCLLPRTFGGHGPLHDAVFSQPELPGFRAKRPDFMWIAKDSAAITAHLIEIEAPGKRWCTNRGQPTAELTQAIDQLRDWK